MNAKRKIVKPGLYQNIPDDVYHAGDNTPQPSLSQSLLKLLIPPSTPAHFAHRRANPEGPKKTFDIGRAAHTRALGVGEEMAACPVEFLSVDKKMTTKGAREWAAEQRANGRVPLTPGDYDMVAGMAEALVHHDRVADVLTDPTKQPEVSAYAMHDDTGTWLRGRFDLMGGRLWDYKTSVCADPDQFRGRALAYGYHIQDVAYRTLHELINGSDPGPMIFIIQEKTPPYLVSTVELDTEFERLARTQYETALALYVQCTATGVWPGYPDDLVTITPPPWALRDLDTGPVELDPGFAAELAELAGIDPDA